MKKCDFFKVHNFSWGGHCECSPRAPKYLVTPLDMCTILSDESNAFLLTVQYLLNYIVCLSSRPLITLSNIHGDAGLLARSQYSEGPATGHFDTGFSWFPCA